MKNSCRRYLGLCALGIWLAASAPAQAASANGPYYAAPSWDQKLDAATRFVVLTNWRNEAVLDRETGLVWERTPQTREEAYADGSARNWYKARDLCAAKNVGGRRGWRLASLAELSSLMEPDLGDLASGGALPPGHPFNVDAAGAGNRFWSATSVVGAPASVWAVSFRRNWVEKRDKDASAFDDTALAWCARGAMNADQY